MPTDKHYACMLTVVFVIQPSNKTFRTKMKLAKALKQNRPIPQWFRLKSDTKIQVLGRVGLMLWNYPLNTGLSLPSTTLRGGTGDERSSASNQKRLAFRLASSFHPSCISVSYALFARPAPWGVILLPVCQCNQPVFFLGMLHDPKCCNRCFS